MIRKYDKSRREVLERLISKLIENASRAPSKCRPHTGPGIHSHIKDPDTKRKLRLASVNQEQVEEAPVLIVVCSSKHVSLSVGRYGQHGKEFYSIIDGAFASMLILLTATNEDLGAGFVRAFEDEKLERRTRVRKVPARSSAASASDIACFFLHCLTFLIAYSSAFLSRCRLDML
jgi:nitroreductase